MNVADYLGAHGVFTLDQFKDAFGEGRTKYNLLVRSVQSGSAERVARGVYASRVGRFAATEPDPYLIASAFASDAVIAYHSALELHGLAHSMTTQVQYFTSRANTTFEYRGIIYRPYADPLAKLNAPSDVLIAETTVLHQRGGELVRVTSRERTIVDCLARIDRAGGAEELGHSLSVVPYVDSTTVRAYLARLNRPTIAARVGWLLEQLADQWYVRSDDLSAIHHMVGPGPYYMTTRRQTGQFDARWRLYIPDTMASFVQQVQR